MGPFFCTYYSNYIERDESVTRDRWYHGNTKRKKDIGQFSCAKVALFIMYHSFLFAGKVSCTDRWHIWLNEK